MRKFALLMTIFKLVSIFRIIETDVITIYCYDHGFMQYCSKDKIDIKFPLEEWR